MPLRTHLALVGLASCLVCLPKVALAADDLDSDTRALARKLGYSGVEAYQAGNYADASTKLDKAYRVAPVPSLGLWSARALAKVGKLIEASGRYLEVTQLEVESGDQAVQKKAQADARAELASLKARIPSLTIQLQGAAAAEVSISIDGQPLPAALTGGAQPVNPGLHRIEGTWGAKRASVELTLREGEHTPALLSFETAPTPAATVQPSLSPPPGTPGLGTQRTLAIVAGGVGVVGLGIGTVFGLKSKSSHDEAAKYCTGASCDDQRGVDAGQDAHSAGNVSTVAMVIGALGLAGGVTLWFTAPRAAEAPRAGLNVGFGSVHLRGRF